MQNPVNTLPDAPAPQQTMNRAQRRAAEKSKRKGNGKAAVSPAAELRWSDLSDIYATSRAVLNETQRIEPLIAEALPWVTDKNYLTTTVNTVSNDIVQMVQELQTIYNSHKDKTGGPDIENIMEYFNIATAYETWMTRFNMTVVPSMDALIDIHYAAMIKKAEAEGVALETVTKIPKLSTN